MKDNDPQLQLARAVERLTKQLDDVFHSQDFLTADPGHPNLAGAILIVGDAINRLAEAVEEMGPNPPSQRPKPIFKAELWNAPSKESA